jgi:hypothetical protein
MPALLVFDNYQNVIPLSKINLFAKNEDDDDDNNNTCDLKYYMIYPKLNYKFISGEYKAEQIDIELSKGIYHLLVLLKAYNPDCIINLNKLDSLSGEEISQYISQVKSQLEFYPKIKKLTKKFSKTKLDNSDDSHDSHDSDPDDSDPDDSDSDDSDSDE